MRPQADDLDIFNDRIDLARGGTAFHYDQHMVRKRLSYLNPRMVHLRLWQKCRIAIRHAWTPATEPC